MNIGKSVKTPKRYFVMDKEIKPISVEISYEDKVTIQETEHQTEQQTEQGRNNRRNKGGTQTIKKRKIKNV